MTDQLAAKMHQDPNVMQADMVKNYFLPLAAALIVLGLVLMVFEHFQKKAKLRNKKARAAKTKPL